MKTTGELLKLNYKFTKPIDYYININNNQIYLNDLIGKKIKFEYSGIINCVACGNKIKKSYSQGYCYPCLISLPENDDCKYNPELCKAHLGIYRDKNWSEDNCLKEHYVYLAITSSLKVGVTKYKNIPSRWIDQGAHKAIKLAKTPNRYIAGLIEVELKKSISDRTNWQRMLKNQIDYNINLLLEKERVEKILNPDFIKYIDNDNTITELEYPHKNELQKVKSLNFDKTSIIEGTLMGIKGQYLIFENNSVLNIRKFQGYLVDFYHK